MHDDKIIAAIERATSGISKYLSIMQLLHSVDVSSDANFQRQYNAFYRVRQKSSTWYQIYFRLMEESKTTAPSFSYILGQLKSKLSKYEPSFSSKLVATLDPSLPVWDHYVLKNTCHKPPPYHSSTKHADAVTCYASIQDWYRRFLDTDEAKTWIRLFNENVPTHYKVTDTKKVDFILWQSRR